MINNHYSQYFIFQVAEDKIALVNNVSSDNHDDGSTKITIAPEW